MSFRVQAHLVSRDSTEVLRQLLVARDGSTITVALTRQAAVQAIDARWVPALLPPPPRTRLYLLFAASAPPRAPTETQVRQNIGLDPERVCISQDLVPYQLTKAEYASLCHYPSEILQSKSQTHYTILLILPENSSRE